MVVWSAKFGYTSDGRLDLSQAVILLNATGVCVCVCVCVCACACVCVCVHMRVPGNYRMSAAHMSC